MVHRYQVAVQIATNTAITASWPAVAWESSEMGLSHLRLQGSRSVPLMPMIPAPAEPRV